MKRIVAYMLISLIWINCGDLERDNPLDPKNPNSDVERGILVELFVNDSTGYEYCNYALDAIEKLSQREEYKENLFVLEYHLTNRNANWNDPYANDEFNQRYYEYVPKTSERGIPDAMFNGLVDRIQGASLENIDDRYSEAANALLAKKGYFHIEAEQKISNNLIEFDIILARFGSSGEEDIDLNVVLYEDLEKPRHHFVARKIFQKQKIPFIKRGEVKSFHFTEQLPQVEKISNLFALVLLQDQKEANKKEVFQVAKF